MFESCICIEPDEPVQLLSRRELRARVRHKCGECGSTIEPGQRYEIDNIVFEGDFAVYKTCLMCRNVRRSLFQGGWYYGMMWKEIHDRYCGEDEDGNEFCLCPEEGG